MIKVDKTLPINPDKSGKSPILTRDHIWNGLMMKVDDAKPFVPLMTKCEVTQRLENGVVRDIVFDGMELKERIIFYPKERVEFLRVGVGAEMGTIWNEILEDEKGELHLRFAFELEVPNLTEEQEQEYEKKRAKGYLNAVQATLDFLRNLRAEGRL
jgi:hypothetical protein